MNTFVETLRQPIFGVILMLTAAMLILNVSLAAFTLDDDNKLLLDLGLSTLLLSGLFLAAFSATGVLSREIDNKTVLSVISKPVTRPLFIFGKFTGLIAALGLAYYLSALVFILAQRHGVLQNSSDPWDAPVLTLGFGSVALASFVAAFCNYLYGKHFSTTAIAVQTPLLTLGVLVVCFFDKQWEPIPFASNFVGGQVLLAVFLVFLVVVIMASVALAASTRFGQMMTLIICVVFLLVGLIADYCLGQYAESSKIAALLYGLIPNVGPFWIIDGLYAESAQTAVPLVYVGYATGYATLLTIAIVSIAIIAFQRREVG